jgi:tetratricopeptide (TPR) repeat protein
MIKISKIEKKIFFSILASLFLIFFIGFFHQVFSSLLYTNLSVLSALKGNTSVSYDQSSLAKSLGFINSGQYYNQYMLDHNSYDLKRAFLLNPTNVNFIFLYADETILNGDWLSSSQHFNKIPFARYLARRGMELAYDSDPNLSKKGLYYLSFSRKILSEPQISSFLGSVLCFKYGAYQKGEPLLWEVLKENPKNTTFYDNLSQMFAYQGKQDLYRSCNELSRRLNPSNINTLLSIGNSFVQDNKIEEGVQYLLYAKAKDKKNPQIHYLLARAFEKQGKSLLAEKEYIEAIEFNPANDGPRFEWGIYLYQKKDFVRSVTQLTIAITINPSNIWSYYYRGICYLELKNLKKAKTDFEQCILLDPNNQSFKDILANISDKIK